MTKLRLPLMLAALMAAPMAPAMAQGVTLIACVVNDDSSFRIRAMIKPDPTTRNGQPTGDTAWVEISANGGRHCRSFSAARSISFQIEASIAGWQAFPRCSLTTQAPTRNVTLTIFRESRVRLGCRTA